MSLAKREREQPEGHGSAVDNAADPDLHLAKLARRDKTRTPKFQRKGPFDFLGMPLEMRQIIYELLLCPVGEKLFMVYFSRWIPLNHGFNESLLLTCRQVRDEALSLQYSGLIRVRGFDLMDLTTTTRLSTHQGLESQFRPIKKMQIPFSIMEPTSGFVGSGEALLDLLPQLQFLRVDFKSIDDWKQALAEDFKYFVRALVADGVEVELVNVGMQPGGCLEQKVKSACWLSFRLPVSSY